MNLNQPVRLVVINFGYPEYIITETLRQMNVQCIIKKQGVVVAQENKNEN